MKTPLISIIVPTYNSARLLDDFLSSLLRSQNQQFEVIINDDIRTNDDTKATIESFTKKGLHIQYLQENRSMAQGRKRGAQEAKADILVHLDSDMQVTPALIGECLEKIGSGYDALVIPEESFGTTFWAKCKWLEKKCYDGVDKIESLRCIRKQAYWQVNGHDEGMVQSEDKDLDIRVKQAGFRVGRTQNFLYHNEGELHLLKNMRKKMGYSKTVNPFAEAHPAHFRWQANILNRYLIYLKNCKYLLSHPLVYLGMIFMKTCEFGYGAIGFLSLRLHPEPAEKT